MIHNNIEEKHPIVQCITNLVTANDCANALLAVGASPTMAHHEKEVQEVASGCDALVLNLGATDDFKAMELAYQVNKKLGHPIVLDPVGAGGSSYRREFALHLLEQGGITCIRGNRSEIGAIARNQTTQTGVDAGRDSDEDALADIQNMAEELANRFHTIVIISGVIDVVSDGAQTCAVSNGSAQMRRITGTGCMLSALLGAALASGGTADLMLFQSCVEMVSTMGICGEIAEEQTVKAAGGTMTFHQKLIDTMSKLNQNVMDERRKIKKLK